MTILIVDDEELIREGLIARLHYLNIPFDEILEANSGLVACGILKKHHVDICMVDIQMPGMNGLEFIRESMKLQPHIYPIVLSGFAEFAYAQKAMVLGVKAYLLKPIVSQELKAAILKAQEDISRTRQIENAISINSDFEGEKKGYYLEREINELLNEDRKIPKSSSKYPSAFAAIHYDSRKFFCVAVIKIEKKSYLSGAHLSNCEAMVHFAVENMLRYLEFTWEKIAVREYSAKNRYSMVFSGNNKQQLKDEMKHQFHYLLEIAGEKLAVFLSVGVSAITESLSKRNLIQAKEAGNQSLLSETFPLYFYDEIEFSKFNIPASELNTTLNYMEHRNIEKIKPQLDKLFTEEMAKKYGAPYISALWAQLINFMIANSLYGEQFGREELMLCLNMPDEIHSIGEAKDTLWNIMIKCIGTSDLMEQKARGKIYLSAKEMENRYNEELPINELADMYGMTKNYFSSLFRKEMGVSPVTYITKIRMDKAKELLAHTSESVIDVAKAVGYEDGQYFFRVFKKATGFTPLQYRKMKRLGE
ncbi:MAG: helix-turn-helix domain-containing protein [Oscillospiraceae bacterium]